jgi:hypothetical protein
MINDHHEGEDNDDDAASLTNLIVESLCELVECSSYKIRSSWNCIFNCLHKIDLDERGGRCHNGLKDEDEQLFEAVAQDTNGNGGGGYVSSSSESLLTDPHSPDNPASDNASSSSTTSTQASRSASSSSSDGAAGHEFTHDGKLTFAASFSAAAKFDSSRRARRLSSLVDLFHIFLSLAEGSERVLANGACHFLKCVAGYLQRRYRADLDVDCFMMIQVNADEERDENGKGRKAVRLSPKKSRNRTRRGNSVNDFEEDEELYVATNDSLVQERHYEQITSYDRLIELSDANDSSSHIKPFLICIEKLFHILIRGNFISLIIIEFLYI